jgi:hypothetical protein
VHIRKIGRCLQAYGKELNWLNKRLLLYKKSSAKDFLRWAFERFQIRAKRSKKFFGSFFQKRTASFLESLLLIRQHG